MLKRVLKLSQHPHSGKLQPHHHTSYIPLLILLAVVGLVLATFTASAASPGPESGSIGLSGIVPGEAPTVGATIDTPTNGQRFTSSPVTIGGTCPKDTLVEIYKNDIFGGSAVCSSTGVYSFDIDLLIGRNVLLARVYDALNQAGPDSNTVTIFYDALPPQGSPLDSLDFGGAQLLLRTSSVFRGSFPNQSLDVPIDVLGGTPPYAINVQWGDASNNIISRGDNRAFTTDHSYTRAGTYQISLQASDAQGRVAFLTVAAIVNGQPSGSAAISDGSPPTMLNQLLTLWPFYVSALAIVVSFWLGELREKRVLKKQPVVYH
jgi:hypothetical protein